MLIKDLDKYLEKLNITDNTGACLANLALVEYGGKGQTLGELQHFVDVTITKTGKQYPAGSGDKEHWRSINDLTEGSLPGMFLEGSGFLVLDYDHIIEAKDGKYRVKDGIRSRLSEVMDAIHAAIGGAATYTELSVSRTGLHQLYYLGDLATGMYGHLSAKIPLSPSKGKKQDEAVKLEIFAGQNNIVLTGQPVGTCMTVLSGEPVTTLFDTITMLCLNLTPPAVEGGRVVGHNGGKANKAGHAVLLSALAAIPADDRDVWRKVGIALAAEGFAYEVFDKWASKSSNYGGCDDLWRYAARQVERGTARANGGTIINLAKANGWKGKRPKPEGSLEPVGDYTDMGEADVLIALHGDKLAYTTATKYLVYDGMRWEESEIEAQRLAQDLTNQQLDEARQRVGAAAAALITAREAEDDDAIKRAQTALKAEEGYHKFVLSRRNAKVIERTLTSAIPQAAIRVEDLDADGYLLNTPAGTVNLEDGTIRPHDSKDLLTKITAASPSLEGEGIWLDFLARFTSDNEDMARYLQEVAGMFCIGKVLSENLIIAFGKGGNGKSTFFNSLQSVLGDYAGSLSSEVLTADCRKNKSPEIAELRGKRLIIAAELEEGTRLDTATVKKICSTDKVVAEKKYKDPFGFYPSHSVVLYTNHLPRVGTTDSGTWDRLVAVPLLARFRGAKDEVKNYSDYLVQNAGGAILTWMIKGAKTYIQNGGKITLPDVVKDAISEYRQDNDWLQKFIDECCQIEHNATEKGRELLSAYTGYCKQSGEYRKADLDVKQALQNAGFEWHKTKKGVVWYGLRLSEKGREYTENRPLEW